jgi:hypothetical protein
MAGGLVDIFPRSRSMQRVINADRVGTKETEPRAHPAKSLFSQTWAGRGDSVGSLSTNGEERNGSALRRSLFSQPVDHPGSVVKVWNMMVGQISKLIRLANRTFLLLLRPARSFLLGCK